MSTEMLTIQQVAKYFQVHPKTVQNWHKRGLMPKPFVINSGTVRYLKNDIEAMINNHKEKTI